MSRNLYKKFRAKVRKEEITLHELEVESAPGDLGNTEISRDAWEESERLKKSVNNTEEDDFLSNPLLKTEKKESS